MYISVDPKSSTPLYEQIKEQMRLAVAAGAVQPGEQVPTVRELAEDLRINFNTVARAYRELQSEGLLVSHRGRGTFVSDDAETIGREEARKAIRQALQETAETAGRLEVTDDELQQMWREVLENRDKRSQE